MNEWTSALNNDDVDGGDEDDERDESGYKKMTMKKRILEEELTFKQRGLPLKLT